MILRTKREAPFPKGGLLRLAIAGTVSVVLATLLTIPISALMVLVRSGAITDIDGFVQVATTDPEALKTMLQGADDGVLVTFLWSLADMFFGAGLLEEGLKYLTGRAARSSGL